MSSWDHIRGKLEQLESILEIEFEQGWTMTYRLDLIVKATLSQRTAIEAARRDVSRWRDPVMASYEAERAIRDVVEAEGRGQ